VATEGNGTTRRILLGIAVTAALAFGGWWWLAGGDPPGRGGGGAEERVPVPITRPARGPARWSIGIAQTVAIDRDDLPLGGEVGVDLVLAEPSADVRPLAGRILSFDVDRPDRERALEAVVVGDDRRRVRMEIPVGFLIEDTYLIEIKTTERTALPVRRYRLEVR